MAGKKAKGLRPAEPVRRKPKMLRKAESMRIRISTADKELLDRAAARVGLGLSGFVLSAALEKARAALAMPLPTTTT